jgi:hypothetical protein
MDRFFRHELFQVPEKLGNRKLTRYLGVGIVAGMQKAILRFGGRPEGRPLHIGDGRQERAGSSGKNRPRNDSV